MKSLRWSALGLAVLTLCASVATACRPTFVVVPGPEHDTVYDTVEVDRFGTRAPRVQRVPAGVDTLFRVDTVLRVDTVHVRTRDTVTVVRVDTILVPTTIGRPRTDTVLRVDTVRTVRVDTVRLVRPDTVRIVEVDTVVRVDTLRLTRADTVRLTSVDTVLRVDTLRLTRADTVRLTRVDTLLRVDTLRVTRADTVRLTTVDTLLRVDTLVTPPDTVRVAVVDTLVVPGRRVLFVPPGHYPPEGQCRVWIHDRPPGQQADAGPCDALSDVPAGAFILFGSDAWDFDYDWVREAERSPGSVPAQIVAVKRRGSG